MNTKDNQLLLELDSVVTVFTVDGLSIDAEAFKITDYGIFLDNITYVNHTNQEINSQITNTTLLFFPMEKIDHILFKIKSKEVTSKTSEQTTTKG